MIEILENLEIDSGRGKGRPIYEQVADHIREKICSSNISAGVRLPAISQMMREWNLAYPTIKSALEILESENILRCEQGRGKGPLILKPVEKKSYRFAFHRWKNEAQFINLEKGIKAFVEQNNHELKVIDAYIANSCMPDVLTSESENFDGLIVYPIATEEYIKAIKDIQALGVKVVFVDRFIEGLSIGSASADNFSGGYTATTHLIETHNCPVYYFGNTLQPTSAQMRYQGWYQAMKEHFTHLDFNSDYLWEIFADESRYNWCDTNDWEQPAYEMALKSLSKVDSEKCCVFCSNDDAARIMTEAAKDNNRVPGVDFFVIGFGDKPFCERLDVPLSSVAQFDQEVGYAAAELLESIIERPSLSNRMIKRIVPVELKIRASSIKKVGSEELSLKSI
ncbi:Arabinose metabolism transcriptional repressor [Limihaloglobus sulfuriphilus]|uniref:Arabinose metabolism transcriptional repressor n=1 Tax=Limihaloglobus sulfuriphilus TaxID=1851148 RepID=A0A1Q2MBY0_9BACT|nr:GntR family transcriptional regulator [Limihaloglobus sulfuriphilus]AQQ70223.1 Arabinose metabolism transcriptional repressor [Limihaloglobus sulfuriphilus]